MVASFLLHEGAPMQSAVVSTSREIERWMEKGATSGIQAQCARLGDERYRASWVQPSNERILQAHRSVCSVDARKAEL